MNTTALLLGVLIYLALGMALATATGCTPSNLLRELMADDIDADDLDINRHILVALALVWVALLVFWPALIVYAVVVALAPDVHFLGHRLVYHPNLDCTDEEGWYGTDICGRRPLAWIVRR